MVGALTLGPVADRVGRKAVIVASIGFFGLFSLSSAFADSTGALILLRFLTGLGIGGTMPNIIANEEVFPEFIQNAATPENISRAALELLQNESRRKSIKAKLAQVITSLGGPGASTRAAQAITQLLEPRMPAK